jgi:hypothetical protein
LTGWEPRTDGDRRAQALGAVIGCCGNAVWRGRLCPYHQGWSDGWDERAAFVEPPDPPSFTCPRCGRTSHNPADVAEGYCGACHAFTREPEPR